MLYSEYFAKAYEVAISEIERTGIVF